MQKVLAILSVLVAVTILSMTTSAIAVSTASHDAIMLSSDSDPNTVDPNTSDPNQQAPE